MYLISSVNVSIHRLIINHLSKPASITSILVSRPHWVIIRGRKRGGGGRWGNIPPTHTSQLWWSKEQYVITCTSFYKKKSSHIILIRFTHIIQKILISKGTATLQTKYWHCLVGLSSFPILLIILICYPPPPSLLSQEEMGWGEIPSPMSLLNVEYPIFQAQFVTIYFFFSFMHLVSIMLQIYMYV